MRPTSNPPSTMFPSGPGLNSMPMRESAAASSSTSTTNAASGSDSTSSARLTVPPFTSRMISAPPRVQQELHGATSASHRRLDHPAHTPTRGFEGFAATAHRTLEVAAPSRQTAETQLELRLDERDRLLGRRNRDLLELRHGLPQ